jgi:dihydrofolate reductase
MANFASKSLFKSASMKAIIAVNNLGFIGKEGTLPWRCKQDLQHFKKLTAGASVLVGHNTFETLPPLPGREIVLDRRGEYLSADWCIGGKKTYEKYQHLFTELHISHINDNSIGDTLLPSLDKLNPDCVISNYHFDC